LRNSRNAKARPINAPTIAAATETPATAPFDNPAFDPELAVLVPTTTVVTVVEMIPLEGKIVEVIVAVIMEVIVTLGSSTSGINAIPVRPIFGSLGTASWNAELQHVLEPPVPQHHVLNPLLVARFPLLQLRKVLEVACIR
jgi:hypothetical protein